MVCHVLVFPSFFPPVSINPHDLRLLPARQCLVLWPPYREVQPEAPPSLLQAPLHYNTTYETSPTLTVLVQPGSVFLVRCCSLWQEIGEMGGCAGSAWPCREVRAPGRSVKWRGYHLNLRRGMKFLLTIFFESIT